MLCCMMPKLVTIIPPPNMRLPVSIARLTPTLAVQLARTAAEIPPQAICIDIGQVTCSNVQSVVAGLTIPPSRDRRWEMADQP